MNDGQLWNIPRAARALGKEKNRRLIHKLILAKGIKHRMCGREIILEQEGFEELKIAVAEWDSRPILSRMTASA
ncbi:hypothetical protein V5E97_17375 [Singulisphaera sp. Ch08]|uniref:Uncharacterized protein n=1 Tax=Singulisphaera sp. Ch08 TaxID=3120278 RepID=A0AAU7CQL3_9BACT